MKTLLAFAGVMLMTIGCAPVPPPDGGDDVPTHANPAFTCDASKAQSLIGRPASAELAAEAQRLSGAGTVRWLEPGQVVTMEFREDRLNIEVDDQRKVISIRCG